MIKIICAFLLGMIVIPFFRTLPEFWKIMGDFWKYLPKYHPDAYDYMTRNNYAALPPLGKFVVRIMLLFKHVEPYDSREKD